MAQFNHNLSLYIPVVQKWQATEQYFKNAFKSSFVGNVVRVDFVARNGGDPALATELSAYVYLEWFYNELSTSWQQVIFAKDPQMPAHFYHTVGRNYWILCENLKPRTVEQVAEEKKVALAKQGITIIDPHGNNTKLLEKLNKSLSETEKLKSENAELKEQVDEFCEQAKLEKVYEDILLRSSTTIKDQYKEIDLLKSEISELNARNANLEMELEEALVSQSTQYMNEDLAMHSYTMHLNEVERLKSENAELNARNANLEMELEQANEDHVKDKARKIHIIQQLKSQLTQKQEDITHASTHKIFNTFKTNFKCNSCSTDVSFTSGNETFADKKHLCHTCFVKTGAWLM